MCVWVYDLWPRHIKGLTWNWNQCLIWDKERKYPDYKVNFKHTLMYIYIYISQICIKIHKLIKIRSILTCAFIPHAFSFLPKGWICWITFHLQYMAYIYIYIYIHTQRAICFWCQYVLTQPLYYRQDMT